MRFAVCSDEPYDVNELAVKQLESAGHEVVRFGSLATGKEAPWAEVARDAAEAVSRGECDEGVFFCWTGTGIAMAANKVPGIRAALCTDAETARGARVWNHANVLALSNRLCSPDLVKEILAAWLETKWDERGDSAKRTIAEIEKRHASRS
jgi:ribose 5-phosphate isomerase B